jgi:hypothetical protein
MKIEKKENTEKEKERERNYLAFVAHIFPLAIFKPLS